VAEVGFLSETPLDPVRLSAAVSGRGRGAVVSFVGTVRDHHEGRGVVGLEYSAYAPMAETVAAALIREAEERWPVAVAMRHRVGKLDPGDSAVVIVVAGDHREEAFSACRRLIEDVKRRVPIWKREYYADGTESWVDPTVEGAGKSGAGAGEAT